MSLLEVSHLSKVFGGVHAVEDLSFNIEPGAIHSIIGPNGAGKTTLFNLITGVYTPTTGGIRFDGQDIVGEPTYERAARGISRSFQNLQIFFNMTALENIMVGRHLHMRRSLISAMLRFPASVRSDEAARDKAAELLHFIGLEQYLRSDADSLPYGALKRLEIARALASEPKLLLLDEPAAGCNARETQEIDDLINKVAGSGVTVVLVEHDMRLVMGISDHILVIDYGKKLTEGSAAEVRKNPDVIAAYLGAGAAGAAGQPKDA